MGIDGAVCRRRNAQLRAQGAFTVAAVLAFAATATVLAFARADLNAARSPLSAYLVGPHAVWLQAAYLALALALLALGEGCQATLPDASRPAWVTWAWRLGAAALVVTSKVPFHASAHGPSWYGTIHLLAAGTTFISVTAAMIGQSKALGVLRSWGRQARVLWWGGWAIHALLWIYALSRRIPHAPPPAVLQKTLVAGILIWLAFAAARLSRWPESLAPERG